MFGPLLPNLADFAQNTHWAGNSWLPIDLQETQKEVVGGWTDEMLYEMLQHRINVAAFAKWRMIPGISGGSIDKSKFVAVRVEWMHKFSDFQADQEKMDVFLKNSSSMKYHAEQLIGFVFLETFLT